jgi:hypothetical protein
MKHVTAPMCAAVLLALSGAALAGPGPLPAYPDHVPVARSERRGSHAPYALTGRSRTRADEGWTARTDWTAGGRDRRIVFERGTER